MSRIHLADGLTLPADIATQTLLVVGKRGSGKSNTCVRLAEQLFAAKIPFVAIDPVDNWWGLKSSKDGTKPGLPVTIFGGPHGDVPLEPTGGALVADVIVENRSSAVLSIRHFSNRERARFVADFFDRLYRKNKEPLHVFLEEAHEVAPQSPFKGEEEMLGRVTRIWKLGRTSGLGGSAITQRPASLSKNITTQAEILIVHRMIGPQDVAAIKEWIKYHGESEAILGELSTLKTGEAFVWAPDFPESHPIGLKRVQILERETYDSAATPKAGHVRKEPKVLATPDLAKIREQMAATIERAREEDPKSLRLKISQLEREVREMKMNPPAAKVEQVEVPVFSKDDVKALDDIKATVRRVYAEMDKMNETLHGFVQKAAAKEHARLATIKTQKPPIAKAQQPAHTGMAGPRSNNRPAIFSAETKDVEMSRPQQRILDGLAFLSTAGVKRGGWSIVAFLGGQSPKSSGFEKNISVLRSAELLTGGRGDGISLTEAGEVFATWPDVATPAELQAHVLAMVSGPQRLMLEFLLHVHPTTVAWDTLAEQTGQSPKSSGFEKNVSVLRSLGLISGGRSERLTAMPVLFLEGA